MLKYLFVSDGGVNNGEGKGKKSLSIHSPFVVNGDEDSFLVRQNMNVYPTDLGVAEEVSVSLLD